MFTLKKENKWWMTQTNDMNMNTVQYIQQYFQPFSNTSSANRYLPIDIYGDCKIQTQAVCTHNQAARQHQHIHMQTTFHTYQSS